MERKSELEQFLQTCSAEGQVDSHGTFTVGGEEALRKIAEYQLPFEGAWAVKIIQSIVAAGSTSPIRVDLGATEIRFYFQATGFTLEEFFTAFHTPEPSPNRALRHLCSGLWPVGLKERWGFQIALPGRRETLIWDGQQLNRFESPIARDCTCISIAPLQQKTAFSWVAGIAVSGSRNAELLLVLSRICYPCPLPLTVDGRRIDSLQRAKYHGWSSETYPLSLGFAEAPLPELPLPPGTFDGVTRSTRTMPSLGASSIIFDDHDGGGWERIAINRWKALSPRESAPLAYIVCVNMKNVQSGKSRAWHDGVGPSAVYWVLDGALISVEKLFMATSHCSLGCFLNADGLQTDLSTFQLLESPEREQRVGMARDALLTALRSFDDSDFDNMVKRAKQIHYILGGVVLVASVPLLWATPVLGFVGMTAGAILANKAGGTERSRVQSARASLIDLSSRIRSRKHANNPSAEML